LANPSTQEERPVRPITLARLAIGATFVIGLALTDVAVAKDIKLCLISSRTGDYAGSTREVEAGFLIGLDFATKGTMKIGDDKVSVVIKDDQLKPDLGKSLLAECYDNDKADIAIVTIGRVASAAMPIADERKRILITLTGREPHDTSSRYVFHAGISFKMEALSKVATVPGNEDVFIGMLTEDVPLGRYLAQEFATELAVLRPRAKVIAEERVPAGQTNIKPFAERLFGALKEKTGKRMIVLNWAGAEYFTGPEPAEQLATMQPARFNIAIATRANQLLDLNDLRSAVGTEGVIYYYHSFPKNPANDWLKAAYPRFSKTPPDYFAVHGFALASAAVTALAKAGTTDTEKLIAVMEGMAFETPKGTMTFRKEDHQVLQDMYHWRMGRNGKVELIATIPASDFLLPIIPSR
jgi:branched-chain amino acid transport system substrate-binding protein